MAKRVNKRFLIILTAVVMGLGTTALLSTWYLTRGNTAEYISTATRLVKDAQSETDPAKIKDDYEEALKYYARAMRNDPSNKDLCIKAGDVCSELVRYDGDYLWKDVRQWNRALELDPDYVPALERVVNAYIDFSELSPRSAENWATLKEKAHHLASVKPGNYRAKAYEHVASLGPWLYAGRPMSERDIEVPLAALEALLQVDATETVIPTTIANARLRLAAQHAANNDAQGAAAERKKAVAVLEEAIKKRPDDPSLLYRYSTVLMTELDKNHDGRIDMDEARPAMDLLEKASSLVKKQNDDFAVIKITWADSLVRQGKRDDAIKVLRDALKDAPNEIALKVALAKQLRATQEGRTEAIEMLSVPTPDDRSVSGFKAFVRRNVEFDRLQELTLLQIDEYPGSADKAALRTVIDDNLRQLARFGNDNAALMALRGYTMLLDSDRNTYFDGIQLLENAVKRNDQDHRFDAELLYRLAKAYISAPSARDRQPGQARMYLMKLLERRPGAVSARKLLVAVLLQQRQYEQARAELAILEQQVKDDPDLIRSRIAVMIGLGQGDKVQATVEGLEEKTRSQRIYKAAAAQSAKLDALADRLMRELYQDELKDPKSDYAGTQMLVRSLLTDKKREEALGIVKTALATNPNSPRLKLMQSVLDGKTSAAQLGELVTEVINESGGSAGPGSAIPEADLLRRQGHFAEALKVLQDAAKSSPSDPQLLTALFTVSMDLKQYDLAQQYGEQLGKLDADHASGLYYRTKLMLARGDAEGALNNANELVRRLDTLASSWIVQAQAQQALGRYESAVSSYKTALDRQADNFEALYGLVECHTRLGQFAIAREYIQRGLRTGSAAFFAELARRLEEAHGDPRTVTATREQMARDNPKDFKAQSALADNYIRVYEDLSRKNDTNGASTFVTKAIGKLQEIESVWPDDASAASRLSLLYQRLGKKDEALKTLQAFAARDAWKDKPEPWLMIAHLQLRAHDYAKAEEAYNIALKRSNNSPRLRQQLAAFYLQTGHPDKGLALLRGLAQETKDPSVRETLIQVLVGQKQFDEAEKETTEGLAAYPDDPSATDASKKARARLLSLMAYIKMGQGDNDNALKYIAQTLQLDSQNAAAIYYRGMIKLSKGGDNLPDAIADLTAARNFAPNNPDIRAALFDALRRRGQIDDAANELEAALQIEPTRRDLRQKLVGVYFEQNRWAQVERVLQDAMSNPDTASDATWPQLEAQMWIERNDLGKALAAVTEAAKLEPNNPQVNYTFLNVLLRMKDYDQVISITNKVINSNMERPWWMYMSRATALAGKGQAQEANGAFDSAMSAVDVNEDSAAAEKLTGRLVQVLGTDKTAARLSSRVKPYWAIYLVKIYAQAGEWGKAVAAADAFRTNVLPTLKHASLRMHCLAYLGQAYTGASTSGVPGCSDKAEAAYTEFLAGAGKTDLPMASQLQALNNLAYLFSESNTPNLAKALNFSQRAYDMMTQVNYVDPSIADTHAWMLILNGRIDDGIDILSNIVAGANPIPDAHYHLAEAYYRKNRFDDALSSLSKAREALKEAKQGNRFVDPQLEGRINKLADQLKQATKSANTAEAGH